MRRDRMLELSERLKDVFFDMEEKAAANPEKEREIALEYEQLLSLTNTRINEFQQWCRLDQEPTGDASSADVPIAAE